MRGLGVYLAAGILVVLAMDFIAPPVGVGLDVVAWPKVEQDTLVQHVDRMHKGDRLPMPTAAGKQMAPKQKHLLVGCDPAFSTLSVAARANFSARCVAAMPVARDVAG
jgi:hypothetical protein